MSKLNLSEMGAQEILTRKELKQIVGGFNSGSGSNLCPDGQKLYDCTASWTATSSPFGIVCKENDIFV